MESVTSSISVWLLGRMSELGYSMMFGEVDKDVFLEAD